MIRTILTRQSVLVAVSLAVLAASPVPAQDRVLLKWTGRVDKEVQLTIRDTTVTASIVGGQPVQVTYFDVKDRLPTRDGTVRVELNAGRGDVDVLQQPSAGNGHAAIIRIRDKSTGMHSFDITVYWNPQRGEDRYGNAAATARASAGVTPANTMHWVGSVDSELRIEWRGTDVMTRTVNGETAREVHSNVTNGLPARDVRVELIVRKDVAMSRSCSSRTHPMATPRSSACATRSPTLATTTSASTGADRQRTPRLLSPGLRYAHQTTAASTVSPQADWQSGTGEHGTPRRGLVAGRRTRQRPDAACRRAQRRRAALASHP